MIVMLARTVSQLPVDAVDVKKIMRTKAISESRIKGRFSETDSDKEPSMSRIFTGHDL